MLCVSYSWQIAHGSKARRLIKEIICRDLCSTVILQWFSLSHNHALHDWVQVIIFSSSAFSSILVRIYFNIIRVAYKLISSTMITFLSALLTIWQGLERKRSQDWITRPFNKAISLSPFLDTKTYFYDKIKRIRVLWWLCINFCKPSLEYVEKAINLQN